MNLTILVVMQWLEAHPAYLENVLYIGGDSFSGIIVPMIVQQILDGMLLSHSNNSSSFFALHSFHLVKLKRVVAYG